MMAANAAHAALILLFSSSSKSLSMFIERPSPILFPALFNSWSIVFASLVLLEKRTMSSVKRKFERNLPSTLNSFGDIVSPCRTPFPMGCARFYALDSDSYFRSIRGGAPPVEMIRLDIGVDERKSAEGEDEEWSDEVTGFRENRQDVRQMGTQQNQHRLHFATEPSLHERRVYRVYRHSPVAPSALGLLQSNHVKFDTLCSSEKGMHISVCEHCSRVASTQFETVSMASRACVALVQNQRRPEQPEI
ncbi:hypothetical protein RB195_008108 [Necator americanus]|uniref:Uncharacterized protein n=1 Tax=Necator americanus TaxID=51031 RepID=A0ABR1CQF1_NECAM